MTKLQVTMIGPEVSKQRPQRLGSVVISRMESKAEEAMIPSMFESGVAIIFQPGMQSNTPPWKTALSLLRDWNSLTIVTSYSHENHKTYDAVHDEDILTRYFGMNMVLSSYLNPARLANSNGVCKNCYVCAFQGATADPEFIPWTDEQLLLESRLAFMGALVTILVSTKDNHKQLDRAKDLLQIFVKDSSLLIRRFRCWIWRCRQLSIVDKIIRF